MTNNSHSDPSPIVVMDRGGCHFVTKTHYAQLIGAKLVLIMDNREKNEEKILMVYNGFGSDISIPTIMISKEDGRNIYQYLESNKNNEKDPIVLSFHFEMPNPDDTVEYEFWMTSMNVKSFEFLKSFQPFQKMFRGNTTFTPHYALFFCRECKV